jgi:hypothetical protein
MKEHPRIDGLETHGQQDGRDEGCKPPFLAASHTFALAMAAQLTRGPCDA